MRISTQMFYDRSVTSVVKRQANLSELQTHLSEQKEVVHGSDDPVAISAIQRLRQDISVSEKHIQNGELAANSNAIEETSIAQAVNLLQRSRELLVAAGNGTYNTDNREALATELEQVREELIGVANTRDANGQYIFSGYEVDTQPFQVNEFGTVDYHGDDGVRNYQIGPGVKISGNEAGDYAFMNIATGNGTYLSSVADSNQGSGVIDEAQVIDETVHSTFSGNSYSISMNEPTPGADIEYRVYGIKQTATFTGSATVKIASLDPTDAGFATQQPTALYPEANGTTNIVFTQTAPNTFDVIVGGNTAVPQYDSSNTNPQTVVVNGVSLEISGTPVTGDTMELTAFVGATQYEENQDIEFNGLKTQIKGKPFDKDVMYLEPASQQSVFATLQQAIAALRIPGEGDVIEAKIENQLNMSKLQVDSALDRVKNIRSSVGARLNTIERQRESSEDFKLTSQKVLSQLEDLDMAEAISEFQLELTSLQVAQQTFVQLQNLSLFNFL
ncbi:flagellar hook-associated protein FlgL [Dongshaea marina]|uniref:flagellar hook-associated protein FlgL n=1 Tax=Dongshaea marina TaxID=2047966 RepID=UPI000D3E9F41|nr:flagellar hook-associated protein FlgL [Dongshaea marina]